MAQALESNDKQNQFRQNAASSGVTGISLEEARLQNLGLKKGFAQNDPRFDADEERDEHGKKKKKKFELAGNSDEAQLARSSGNFNIGETWEEYGSNPVAIQQQSEAASQKAIAFQQEQSFFDSVYDYGYDLYDQGADLAAQGWDWAKDTAGDIYDFGAEVYDSASTAVSEAIDWVGEKASEAGTAIAKTFNEYVTEPAGKAVDWAKEKASEAGTAISNAASSVATTVSNAASTAGTAISNAASSVATTVSNAASTATTAVSNAASSAGASISSGWNSLKNFALGESKPAETQTAEAQKPEVVQTLAKPADKPTELVGDKNDVRLNKAPSLSSAWSNAVDGPAQVADATPATPAPRPVPAPAPATTM